MGTKIGQRLGRNGSQIENFGCSMGNQGFLDDNEFMSDPAIENVIGAQTGVGTLVCAFVEALVITPTRISAI